VGSLTRSIVCCHDHRRAFRGGGGRFRRASSMAGTPELAAAVQEAAGSLIWVRDVGRKKVSHTASTAADAKST